MKLNANFQQFFPVLSDRISACVSYYSQLWLSYIRTFNEYLQLTIFNSIKHFKCKLESSHVTFITTINKIQSLTIGIFNKTCDWNNIQKKNRPHSATTWMKLILAFPVSFSKADRRIAQVFRVRTFASSPSHWL